MSTRTSRRLAAALIAALLLAAGTSTATARNYSISNQNVRATLGNLEFASSVNTVRCQVTLEGSFHNRTIAKVARSLIGYVTRATVKEESCTNGIGRPRTETLPWHITYEGFTGTLPNISAILPAVSRVRFQLTVPGICTGDYGASEDVISGQANITPGTRRINTLAAIAGRNIIRRISGSAFCPAQGSFNGTGIVMLLGTTNQIEILLI